MGPQRCSPSDMLCGWPSVHSVDTQLSMWHVEEIVTAHNWT